MTIKASGRSALIAVTGLFVCFAGPSQAATGADGAATAAKSEAAGAPVALGKYAKHGARHVKKVAYHRSGKAAPKASDDPKPEAAADDIDQPAAMPPSVANANAQLNSPDTPTGDAAKAMTARANDILQTPDKAGDGQVVAPDQFNEVDRALHEAPPPATTLAMASADAPAAPTASAPAANNQLSTWDQTSLIGKIFIGFGALLTMASAARMFMA